MKPSKPTNVDAFDFNDILDDDGEQGFKFCIMDRNSYLALTVVEGLRGMNYHAFNQKGKEKLNQFDFLFYNQLTMNIIQCALFLINIR